MRSADIREEKSLGDLFSDLSQKASFLVRQEVQLAKVEMKEKVTTAGRELALIGVGIFLANAALLSVVAFLIALLSQWMAVWLAALLVGIVLAVVAGVLIWNGINTLKQINPTPQQTVTTLQENKEWLAQQVS
jgi:uncharacterized membrane protein YqjE